jgi:oxygen-dependent protoporphyrinogen oxidase
VVLAVPAARLAGLVKTIAPPTAAAAGRIISASSVVVALALPRGINFPQNSGVLVASGEPLHAKAITLSSRKWGRGCDVELLRLSFGRLGDDIAARASDEKLLSWAIEDLAAVFGLAVEPVDVRVQRWPDAMPQYGPGHRDLVDELRAGLPATLTVAGSYLDGIGVPACVGVAGRAAAAAVLAVESSVAR